MAKVKESLSGQLAEAGREIAILRRRLMEREERMNELMAEKREERVRREDVYSAEEARLKSTILDLEVRLKGEIGEKIRFLTIIENLSEHLSSEN